MKRILRIIIFIIAVCVLVFSLYMIISIQLKYKQGKDTYNDISSKALTVAKSFSPPNLDRICKVTDKDEILPDIEYNEVGIPLIEAEANALPIEVDYNKTDEYNKDIIGWIYCPETNINYPVLHAADNNYYLRRMANKKYNIAGSIFMDYRNKGDFSDINTIIYGHNMKNGTMFSDLMNYKNDNYFDSHPYIYYDTEDKSYIFKIIGGKVVDPSDKIFSTFSDETEMQDYLAGCTPKYLFNQDTDIYSINRLVTLSTCSNDAGTMRYVLFCIPIEVN